MDELLFHFVAKYIGSPFLAIIALDLKKLQKQYKKSAGSI